MLTKILNAVGLFTRAQMREREQRLTAFERAAEPLVLFALESGKHRNEALVTWKSDHYGSQTTLFTRDLDPIGRCLYGDYDLRRLGIPENAPVYVDWKNRKAA